MVVYILYGISLIVWLSATSKSALGEISSAVCWELILSYIPAGKRISPAFSFMSTSHKAVV